MGTTATPAPAFTNGTVATGRFGSPDGKTSGTVTVALQNGELILHLDGFRSTEPGALDFQLSPWGPSTRCPVDEHSWIIGQPGLIHIGIGSIATDSTFYKTVVVARAPTAQAPTDKNGCLLTGAAPEPEHGASRRRLRRPTVHRSCAIDRSTADTTGIPVTSPG